MAWRTVTRATWNSTTKASSEGTLVPGPHSPRSTRWRSKSASWEYSGTGLSGKMGWAELCIENPIVLSIVT